MKSCISKLKTEQPPFPFLEGFRVTNDLGSRWADEFSWERSSPLGERLYRMTKKFHHAAIPPLNWFVGGEPPLRRNKQQCTIKTFKYWMRPVKSKWNWYVAAIDHEFHWMGLIGRRDLSAAAIDLLIAAARLSGSHSFRDLIVPPHN